MKVSKSPDPGRIKRIIGGFADSSELTSFLPFGLETDGRTNVHILGCAEPLFCSAEKMSFRCGSMITHISGAELMIALLSENDTEIRGVISCIDFEY